MLEPEQFAEIELARDGFRRRLRHALGNQLVEPVLLELHLQLFVETVRNLSLDAVELSRLRVIHGHNPLRTPIELIRACSPSSN